MNCWVLDIRALLLKPLPTDKVGAITSRNYAKSIATEIGCSYFGTSIVLVHDIFIFAYILGHGIRLRIISYD